MNKTTTFETTIRGKKVIATIVTDAVIKPTKKVKGQTYVINGKLVTF